MRALALVSLGITEFWAARFEEAERHLDEGVTLARRIGRPFLEFSGLVYQAGIELFRSFTRAAERSRQAIELAEPDGRLLWFMLYPAPDLLERRARQRTAHAALIAQILDLLAGPGGCGGMASPRLAEPLSQSELRVLRYLPTHLSAPEIASELSVSLSTVKTHMRNLYAKLGGHSRAEAVERARALGLLAPSAHL